MANTENAKKPIYKKWWFWVIIAVVLLFIIAGASGNKDSNNKTETTTETLIEATTEEPATEATTEATTEKPATEATTKSNAINKEDLQEAVKDKYSLVFFGDVRNDTTGNWRYAGYSESDSQEQFAVEYYKAFFENDKEIHAVINFTRKTTARVSLLDSNTLDVSILEYVQGEEHDAKELFGGTLLKEYWVSIDSGEIEEIQ